MKARRLFKVKKSFNRFLLSYILVLCFTILIGMITYIITLNMFKENAINDSLISLEKGRDVLDARFTEIGNMIVQIMFQDEIQSTLRLKTPLQNKDYYTLRSLFHNVTSLMLTNNFVSDVFIIFKDSNTLISSQRIYDNINNFYGPFLYYKNIDYSTWYENVLASCHNKDIWPANTVVENGVKSLDVTYLQSIPLGEFRDPKGVIMVLINVDKIFENMQTFDTENGGSLVIIDNKGKIISSFNNNNKSLDSLISKMNGSSGYTQQFINGEEFVAIYSTSSVTGWKYVALLPSKIFNLKAAYVNRLFLIAVSIVLILGLLIALYMSYRNSKPIEKLIKCLLGGITGEEIPVQGELDFIEGTISKLIINNKALKEEVEKQVPFQRSLFFERLLRGDFSRIQELQKAMDYARLNIDGDGYVVLFVRFYVFSETLTMQEKEEFEVIRILGEKAAKKYLGNDCYLHNIENEKLAVLITLNNNNNEIIDYKSYLNTKMQSFIKEIWNEFNINAIFSIISTINPARPFFWVGGPACA